VRKYVRTAEEAGYTLGVRRFPQEWAEFVHERFPRAADGGLRCGGFARIGPYRERVRKDLEGTGSAPYGSACGTRQAWM